MNHYMMLSRTDSSSAASMLVYGGETLDELVRSVSELGGSFQALVATGGRYALAGFLEFPDEQAAVAFRMVQDALGRSVELIPVIPVSELGAVIERASAITLPTSPGDEALTEAEG